MPRKTAQAAMSPPMTPAPRMHMTEIGGRFTAQALQAILQQEHAHQISHVGPHMSSLSGSCSAS